MHVLRQIFYLKRIYFAQTPLQIIYFYLFPLLLIILLLPLRDDAWYWAVAAYGSIAVFGFLFIRTIIRTAIVYFRVEKTPEKKAVYVIDSHISDSSVSYELDRVDRLRLLSEGPTWKIYDALFNFYTKTKYGTFLSKQAYYTVYEAKLIRVVPNIIFDSKSAKRRQFKYLFLQSQRLSLEGNFDKYFDAYTPQTYHIDTLSFITPEVMWAMIELKDYDIELFEDKVLCYGPLLDIAELNKMETICQNLADHINDNLKTYRDNRLEGDKRKTHTTPFARNLLKSPMRYVPALVLSGIVVAATIFAGFKFSFEIMNNQISWFALAIFISSLYEIIRLSRKNRRLNNEFNEAQSAFLQ